MSNLAPDNDNRCTREGNNRSTRRSTRSNDSECKVNGKDKAFNGCLCYLCDTNTRVYMRICLFISALCFFGVISSGLKTLLFGVVVGCISVALLSVWLGRVVQVGADDDGHAQTPARHRYPQQGTVEKPSHTNIIPTQTNSISPQAVLSSVSDLGSQVMFPSVSYGSFGLWFSVFGEFSLLLAFICVRMRACARDLRSIFTGGGFRYPDYVGRV